MGIGTSCSNKLYRQYVTGNEEPGDLVNVEIETIWDYKEYQKKIPDLIDLFPGWSLTGKWETVHPYKSTKIQYKMDFISKYEPVTAQTNAVKPKNKYEHVPISAADERYVCPISQAIMEEPSITSCGHTFETFYIKQWQSGNNTCPICKKLITKNITTNYALKGIIEDKYGTL